MRQFTPAYSAKTTEQFKEPIYILELILDKGGLGTEGVNDVYFSTAPVSKINNFNTAQGASLAGRIFPCLQNNISAVSQSLDLLSGVSKIGSMTFKLADIEGRVADIIKTGADNGHGLRRQRCELYIMYSGLDWQADRVKVRTLFVDNIKYSSLKNEYSIQASDAQKQLKQLVCQPEKSRMVVGTQLLATAALPATLEIADASKMRGTLTIANAAGTGLDTGVKHLKVGGEVISGSFSAVTPSIFNVSGRGLFGTSIEDHGSLTPGVVAPPEVAEAIYLRGNPIWMALTLLTGGYTGGNHFQGFDSARLFLGLSSSVAGYPPSQYPQFTEKYEVWDTRWLRFSDAFLGTVGAETGAYAHPYEGLQFEFLFTKGVDAKKFIETEILRFLGATMLVTGDGSLSLKAFSDVSAVTKAPVVLNAQDVLIADAAQAGVGNTQATITDADVISWGELDYQFNEMANVFVFDFHELPKGSGQFVRTSMLVDGNSAAIWGTAKTVQLRCKGVVPIASHIQTVQTRTAFLAARLGSPPLSISVTALSKWHNVEVGDVITLALSKVHDALAGSFLHRAFEVVSTGLDLATGAVTLSLTTQPNPADLQYLLNNFVENTTLRAIDAAYTNGRVDIRTVLFGLGVTYSEAVESGVNTLRIYGAARIGGLGSSQQCQFTGDIIVEETGSITVYGSVQLFITGEFTLLGAIDGLGKGQAAGQTSGFDSIQPGYIGGGGGAGISHSGEPQNVQNLSEAPLFLPGHSVSLSGGNIDPVTGQWGSFTGVPAALWGASGSVATGTFNAAHTSGASGSGFGVYSRGVFMGAAANIDLGGDSAYRDPGASAFSGGGGGGGGTAVFLVEKNPTGIYTFNAPTSVFSGTGGAGGNGYYFSFGTGVVIDWGNNGEPGTAGSFLAGVF
ncbi:MAG: hypothetical protein R8M45_01525 [Ghiorsea sp.]